LLNSTLAVSCVMCENLGRGTGPLASSADAHGSGTRPAYTDKNAGLVTSVKTRQFKRRPGLKLILLFIFRFSTTKMRRSEGCSN